MGRRGIHRHIEFDALETVTLMSLASGMRQEHLLALSAREQSGVPVQLLGSVKGTYQSKHAAGAPLEISVKGTLSPIGHVSVRGKITLSATNPSGSLTLSGKRGTLHATAIGSWSPSETNNEPSEPPGLTYQPPGTPGTGDTGVPGQPPSGPVSGGSGDNGYDDVGFKITDGTGAYASESGNTDAVFTVVAAKGKGAVHGKITIQFVNPTA
jgi:hypothetical protein